ncbi:helix-turn-helix domain-containing protein [Acetobacter persici]|nr:helix-turn-helix domain-containing protein [Acetobacter persici]
MALERARKTGVRAITSKLGRSPSTISREIRHNSVIRNGILNCHVINAQWYADCAAQRRQSEQAGSKSCLA